MNYHSLMTYKRLTNDNSFNYLISNKYFLYLNQNSYIND